MEPGPPSRRGGQVWLRSGQFCFASSVLVQVNTVPYLFHLIVLAIAATSQPAAGAVDGVYDCAGNQLTAKFDTRSTAIELCAGNACCVTGRLTLAGKGYALTLDSTDGVACGKLKRGQRVATVESGMVGNNQRVNQLIIKAITPAFRPFSGKCEWQRDN